MYTSLNAGGKMAMVLDTGAFSRGSDNQESNKEQDLRRTFVEGGPGDAEADAELNAVLSGLGFAD